MKKITWRQLCQHPATFIAFGGGVGLIPLAPGTFGTLLAVLLYMGIATLSWWLYLLVLGAGFIFGCWCCGRAAELVDCPDHPGIIWDEIVGYGITMFLAPLNIWAIVLGFLLFRLFDIVKPWPVNWADKRVGGGLGIMLDDVLAGVYAFLGLQILSMLWVYVEQFN